MKQTNRFWKFVFITLIATLFVLGGSFFFLWQTLTVEQSHTLVIIANNDALYIICLLFICVSVIFIGLQITYLTYIKPLKKISAEASVIYSTNPSHRLNISGNKDINNLSSVINDFADIFENLNKNITKQILSARKETEKERNLLAAIMAELPQGVIICNRNGRILLFNSLAKKIFTQQAHPKKAEYFIGLGRSIFHMIDKGLIAHAIEEIEERLNHNRQSVASYFITPIHADHLISVETMPVLDPERQMSGFILTFQDVTDDVNQYDITHKNLVSLKKESSTHIKLIKNYLTHSHGKLNDDPYVQNQLLEILDLLPLQYEQISNTLLETILTKLPLTKLFLPDFLFTLKHRADLLHGIKLNLTTPIENSRVLIDTYSFTAALIFLIKNLSEITNISEFNLSAFRNDSQVIFEIAWSSQPVEKHFIEKLLSKRMNALPSLFYVLKQNKALLEVICKNHKTDSSQINIIAQAELKTPFKEKQRSPIITGSRPEFYDFDMFMTDEENTNLLDNNLNNITYTVFDTETTGLNPDGGDEIISIAAVRIVNNRIVYQDIFEELVDPKRDIPLESYKIHGINYEMVNGKKDINTILPVFKRYASETVFVGHNIAFDMKMLKVKEKTTGIKFLNSVLDTLLLSAILHPVHEQHDMESIAKRLGVNIIGRHTALGDAIATAEIFLKLLPILNSNGILTLKDAIKASRKTYYARLKY
ncbi:exonuclease domain-containing protein [Desulfobacula sp.]